MSRIPLAFWPPAALLVGAILLGGGGSPAPASEMLLELLAVVCAGAMMAGPARMTGPFPSRPAWLIAALVLLLPTLQLIPLPPSVWQALPGRALEAQALSLVGEGDSWRPWSLFPYRTLAGLLAIVPPLILMLAVSRLGEPDHRRLLAIVATGGLLSLVFGAVQLSGGVGGAFRIYSQSNPGFLNGFQANRNAEADVLLIAIIAAAAVAAAGRYRDAVRYPKWLAGLILALLALGLFLTGSRTGIALLVPVGGLALVLACGLPRRPALAMAAVAIPFFAAVAYLQTNPAVQRVLGRFGLRVQRDFRHEIWTDGLFAIKAFWPFGAGLGAAAPILTTVERLAAVDLTQPNRVHNDFLELALETGVLGPLVLLAITLVLGWVAMRRLRNSSPASRVVTVAALAMLAVVAIHSIVDYPLRSMALAHLAGLAAGMILARGTGRSRVAGNGGTA